MKIKSKEKIIGGIKKVTNVVDGKQFTLYKADCGCFDGKRIRIARASRNELVRAIEDWFQMRKQGGDAALQLTPAQMMDAWAAFDALRRARKPLQLLPIVQEYILSSEKEAAQKGILDAYNEWYASFDGVESEHQRTIKSRVGNFIRSLDGGTACNDVSAADVVKYLDGLKARDGMSPCAVATWNNTMNDIRCFFSWCCKKVRRYCDENPIADLEKKPEPFEMPEFCSVEDVRRLFEIVDGDREYAHRDTVLFFLVLSFFLGMRTEEIKRMSVGDVVLEEGTALVRRPKGFQNGVSHRVVPINDTAAAWLARVDFKKVEKVRDTTFDMWMKAAKNRSGGKFPPNSGRHSFITYHVAAYSDITKTATIAGNTPKIIRGHYQGLTTRTQGEAYFAIRPGSV